MNTHHHFIDTLTHWIIRHRWAVMTGSILIALILGYGASRLEFKNDFRVFFGKNNPQLAAYDRLQRIYTKDDNILIVLTHPDKEVFTREYLEAVQWLTEETWQLPFVTRVDSISNFQHSEAEQDDLAVGDLVETPAESTLEDLERYHAIAHAEPLLKNKLVGDNEHVTGINATLTMPGQTSFEPVEAADAARHLRERFLERHPDFKVHLTGIIMMNDAFAQASIQDMTSLIPLMYVGMFLVMVWILRSGWGTVGTMAVIILSSMAAMGLMGWLGIPLTPPSATAPTIIMTLAVADSIHILVTFLHFVRKGRTRQEAILESMRINFKPVFLTSLTTAIGFLSLNFSDAPPFRHLGNVVAMGVWAAWLFSIFFLPAFLSVAPIRARSNRNAKPSYLNHMAEWIIRHRAAGLWGSLAVVAGLAVFIPRIELNDQWVQYFRPSIEFRGDTDYAMTNLTGIYTVDYSVPSGESGGISSPDYQQHLDTFGQWMREQPEILQVNALTDVMKRLNKNMHGDEASYFRLPDSRELGAQYLLLYEMSLPFGLDLNNQINVDKSASRLTATTANITAGDVRALLTRTDQWQADHLPEVMRAEPTSPTVMFSYISQRNIESMLGGTFLAVLIISLILGFALGSLRYGLLSLIPNMVPAVIGFGIWALLVGSVGMSLSVVTGMTLGIVVDDTVHFLSKYLHARRTLGLDPHAAIRYAFETVGQAMVATTVILMVGFGILSFSAFRLNNWMAQLTTIVIGCALLIDFILLPALLLTFDRMVPDSAAAPEKSLRPALETKDTSSETNKPIYA
jgi:predicted RND superfamily exporter protein